MNIHDVGIQLSVPFSLNRKVGKRYNFHFHFHHQRKLINIYIFFFGCYQETQDLIYIFSFYTCSSDIFPRWNLKAFAVCVSVSFCVLLSLHNFTFPWHNDIELVIWHLGWIFSFCIFIKHTVFYDGKFNKKEKSFTALCVYFVWVNANHQWS